MSAAARGTGVEFTVFTKPWRMPVDELGAFVKRLGFDGIELPVRPGYQVEPADAPQALPKVARQLAEHGVKIASIAGPTDERTIAACAEAEVPIIRICVSIPKDRSYLEHEAAVQRELEALVPALDRSGVAIGIQNHAGRDVANAMGIRHLIERFDPKHVCAVLDPAHCALQGEIPELALDIVWSHMRMVNLKNAVWQRVNGPEAEVAQYKSYWTSGRQGQCSWPKVVDLLKERHYTGPVCLTAEYSDHEGVDRLITEDIAFARSLFA